MLLGASLVSCLLYPRGGVSLVFLHCCLCVVCACQAYLRANLGQAVAEVVDKSRRAKAVRRTDCCQQLLLDEDGHSLLGSGRAAGGQQGGMVQYRLCVARVTQGSRLSLLVERALRCWSSCGCWSCGRARCGLGLERVPEPGLLEREDAGTPVRVVGQFCIACAGGRSENMLAGLGRAGSYRRVERTVELSRNKAVEPLDVLVVQEAAVA